MVKVKGKADVILRRINPSFNYKFAKGEVKDIPEEHVKYLKGTNLVEIVKKEGK